MTDVDGHAIPVTNVNVYFIVDKTRKVLLQECDYYEQAGEYKIPSIYELGWTPANENLTVKIHAETNNTILQHACPETKTFTYIVQEKESAHELRIASIRESNINSSTQTTSSKTTDGFGCSDPPVFLNPNDFSNYHYEMYHCASMGWSQLASEKGTVEVLLNDSRTDTNVVDKGGNSAQDLAFLFEEENQYFSTYHQDNFISDQN